jgi:hypothetical protein
MQIDIAVQGLDQLISSYRQAPKIIGDEMLRSMTRIVIQGEAISKRLVRKKTRTTARSITHKVSKLGNGVRGEWGTVYKVGLWLEKGTKPHKITGNPWLYWKGARHPVRFVNHPGTRPYPFIKPAGVQIRPLANREMSAAMKRAIARIVG